MERRALGRGSLSLPVVGLLAGTAFDVRGKEAQSARGTLVRAALESGVDFFATSPDVGEAERVLAAALVGMRRGATVLTMMCAVDSARAHRDIDRSLHYFDGLIDLCLLDWRVASAAKLDVLERMRAAREATAIGVYCRTLGQAGEAFDATERRELDVIGLPAPLLMLPGFDSVAGRADGAGAGIVIFLPDIGAARAQLAGFPVPGDLATRLSLGSWPDLLLKLALSDARVTSAVVPVARARELATLLEIAGPPRFDAAAMASLRGDLGPG